MEFEVSFPGGVAVAAHLPHHVVPTDQPALVVPSGAVNQGPSGPYVYVVTAQQTAEQRPVVVLRTDADIAVIGRGVQAGERIVVDGQSRVTPGSKVAAKATGAAPQAHS